MIKAFLFFYLSLLHIFFCWIVDFFLISFLVFGIIPSTLCSDTNRSSFFWIRSYPNLMGIPGRYQLEEASTTLKCHQNTRVTVTYQMVYWILGQEILEVLIMWLRHFSCIYLKAHK
jgi:hypothetical protein